MNFKKIVVSLISSLALSACHSNQPTVAYLLEHPDVLETELQYCGNHNDQSSRCLIASEAHGKIMAYVNIAETDPEKFGQMILDAEIACEKLKDELVKLKQNQAAPDVVAKSEKAYEDKHQEVKMLIAIAGLSSPG